MFGGIQCCLCLSSFHTAQVSDVNSHVENGGKEEGEEGEEEGEEEGDLVEVDLTDKDTARLLADDVT